LQVAVELETEQTLLVLALAAAAQMPLVPQEIQIIGGCQAVLLYLEQEIMAT
jgi:hypothetical protein